MNVGSDEYGLDQHHGSPSSPRHGSLLLPASALSSSSSAGGSSGRRVSHYAAASPSTAYSLPLGAEDAPPTGSLYDPNISVGTNNSSSNINIGNSVGVGGDSGGAGGSSMSSTLAATPASVSLPFTGLGSPSSSFGHLPLTPTPSALLASAFRLQNAASLGGGVMGRQPMVQKANGPSPFSARLGASSEGYAYSSSSSSSSYSSASYSLQQQQYVNDSDTLQDSLLTRSNTPGVPTKASTSSLPSSSNSTLKSALIPTLGISALTPPPPSTASAATATTTTTVRVVGFPPSQAAALRAHFLSLGGGGSASVSTPARSAGANWMLFTYTDPQAAEEALALDQSVLEGEGESIIAVTRVPSSVEQFGTPKSSEGDGKSSTSEKSSSLFGGTSTSKASTPSFMPSLLAATSTPVHYPNNDKRSGGGGASVSDSSKSENNVSSLPPPGGDGRPSTLKRPLPGGGSRDALFGSERQQCVSTQSPFKKLSTGASVGGTAFGKSVTVRGAGERDDDAVVRPASFWSQILNGVFGW